MLRRDVSKFLLAGSVGASVAPPIARAQSCVSPCYPRTPDEVTAGVTPVDTSFEPGDIRRYGAVGDGNSSHAAANSTAFGNARAVAAVSPASSRVVFPAGVYYYSVSPNWAISNLTLEAQGHVRLNFTGTGNAWIFDAGTNNLYNARMMGDFVINGNSAATNGVYVVGMHHSQFQARVANVSQAGCDINFCVGSTFRVQTTYQAADAGTYSTIPSRGYYINQRNPGEYTAWCQFHETIVEGVVNFGIDILSARGCSFFGGFVENCGGGIRVDSSNENDNNSFYGFDLESNSVYDIVLYGQHNRLVGCNAMSPASNDNLIIGAGAAGAEIIGGFYRLCTLQAGSDQTVLLNASFSDSLAGIRGPGGYRALGCFLVNTSGTRTSNLPDVLSGAKLIIANLPVSSAGLSAGSLWNSSGTVKIV